MKKKNKKKSQNFSPSKLLLSHLICGIGLASSFWVAINVFSINLIDYPVQTLCLLWLFQAPVVILVYSFFRNDKDQSSYLKAVARGLLGLPVVRPCSLCLRLIESIDYMICIPAYGAVIGAWFGAWPMPLDWERTWQEWPICVTYGAIMGYLVGLLASFGFVVRVSRQRVKGD
ncbi:putative GPI biosynthesis protein Pig-F [Helianthus annuus]|nr:putative GPI biosynthesis protein Pig-F [Helianthus annuus]